MSTKYDNDESACRINRLTNRCTDIERDLKKLTNIVDGLIQTSENLHTNFEQAHAPKVHDEKLGKIAKDAMANGRRGRDEALDDIIEGTSDYTLGTQIEILKSELATAQEMHIDTQIEAAKTRDGLEKRIKELGDNSDAVDSDNKKTSWDEMKRRDAALIHEIVMARGQNFVIAELNHMSRLP